MSCSVGSRVSLFFGHSGFVAAPTSRTKKGGGDRPSDVFHCPSVSRSRTWAHPPGTILISLKYILRESVGAIVCGLKSDTTSPAQSGRVVGVTAKSEINATSTPRKHTTSHQHCLSQGKNSEDNRNHSGGECATVSINSRRPCGCNAEEHQKMPAHILKIGPRAQRKMPKYNLENEYVCICLGIYRMVRGQSVNTLRQARTSAKDGALWRYHHRQRSAAKVCRNIRDRRETLKPNGYRCLPSLCCKMRCARNTQCK